MSSSIAVLADIHGNLPALEAVVADLRRRAVDTVVNLGDHASGPLWPRETVAFLMAQPWLHIAGNHDRQLVEQDPAAHGASDRHAFERLSPEQRAWLRGLPPHARPRSDMLLCHGTPTDDSRYLLETVAQGHVRRAERAEIAARLGAERAPIILCGHSHLARLVQLTESRLIVNPGSVGLPAYEDAEPEPHVIEAGSPHARYALLEQQPAGWHISLINIAYDHQRAARQALANGRPDWAGALQTGYMDTTRDSCTHTPP
jgi:putative phosphoesterase